ncbi:rhodanese-like domain-containing protein [Streptococcus parauberis]|uniref:Rhodanese-like domain-containing protein n=2 Tax=Streptococcus parauberis TaxID=1348 RepID=A0A0E2UCL9_9STRE|nr:rhodanese-like domain-containing protein [Streptococcus parauberis]AEF24626.1 hypothetical protein STP_0178 [Streptococcus parauberis KCTC 11537]AUT05110.1 uncharacterized protein SPSF3K_00369 [Streptococcus parauberis]EMF48430.1 hypothetical protein SPJ2_1643 [Streptococcus parauberis KRS-02109]EMG25203.1 Rhodanese-like protein [Streptococcus parauberis KRS-02083]KYP17892.1 Thiosulfate sulfurtransferase GlpE [Streptococcus parauberis]
MIFNKLFAKQKQETISTQELEELLKTKNIDILDVRTSNEFRSGHIKQSRNYPLSSISSYQGRKDKKIYLICQSGMRSKKACKTLNQMGYQTVNIKGGMSAWTGPKTN